MHSPPAGGNTNLIYNSDHGRNEHAKIKCDTDITAVMSRDVRENTNVISSPLPQM